MNVRDLEISLRPRQGWEAVDLGFILTRNYYKDLFRIGLIGFLPVWLILILLFWKWQGVAVLIIWLLKPLYDRFYLHYFSRRIFGQRITAMEVLKNAPKFLFKHSLGLITWRRLSPVRSMILPIQDLENLKRKEFRKRCGIVKRGNGQIAGLTTVSLHLCEQLILLALIIIIGSLIPYNQSALSFEDSYEFMQNIQKNWFVKLILNLIPCAVFLCLEPFYVGAGFCLYLNSRSKQEAWDVELRFKEFAERLKKGVLKSNKVTSLVLAAAIALGLNQPASAEPNPQEIVEEIYEHKDFEIHTKEISRWVPDDTEMPEWLKELLLNLFPENTSGLGNAGMNELFKLIGIAALAALVITILVIIAKQVSHRDVSRKKDSKIKKKQPDTVMGMAITRESLPVNLIEAARNLWRNGEKKQALSFLYRAALSDIILGYEAEIESSDTEYECQRAAKKVLNTEQHTYFHSLTSGWISVAYSKFPISDQDFETLCNQWLFKTP